MRSWKAVLAALGVFVLGTVFGFIISFRMTPELGAPFLSRVVRQETTQERLHQRVVKNLDLSAEQERAIAAILSDARGRIMELRRETRPRVRQVILDARTRIRAQLTPEQQAKFDQKLQRNRRLLNRLLAD